MSDILAPLRQMTAEMRSKLEERRGELFTQQEAIEAELASIQADLAKLDMIDGKPVKPVKLATRMANVGAMLGQPRVRDGSKQESVFEAIKAGHVFKKDLVKALNIDPQDKIAMASLNNALLGLKGKGRIIFADRGLYEVAEAPST